MNLRTLGKTGFRITELALGTWQVGGKWGSGFDHANADRILNAAVDAGVNFIDTADVYEAGESEKAVGRLLKNRSERIYVATKCGRQISPHDNQHYTPQALRSYVEESLIRLGVEALDLIQLHCPPTEVYYRPEIFELFERLKDEGKILHMGVSVEKIEEAIKAIEFPNVSTVQIIFNMFRQRPIEKFFQLAADYNVGILARVPLASGLLTGKYTAQTQFGEGDHRFFNRDGAAFDKGETFSGIPYQQGLQAVDRLKELFPGEDNLAPRALQWTLRFPEVSCVIPGASKEQQVHSNLATLKVPPMTDHQIAGIDQIYAEEVKQYVHQLW
ncbi:MAG: aldo/keto reductase [Bacteroidota bacterium]